MGNFHLDTEETAGIDYDSGEYEYAVSSSDSEDESDDDSPVSDNIDAFLQEVREES